MNRRGFLAGAACIFPCSARAGESPDALSGDRFRIGVREYILSDILAPSPFSLRGDSEEYFRRSKAALDELLNPADFTLIETGEPNRWRLQPVKALRENDSRTLQEILVEQGVARVKPQTDDFDFIDGLLRLEIMARDARRGLWALRQYRVYDAANAGGAMGKYSLIEGIVQTASDRRGRSYLNFGDDYKTDFTAGARTYYANRWRKAEFDLTALAGKRVRVRGFTEYINGPSIDLTHRQQIEILG